MPVPYFYPRPPGGGRRRGVGDKGNGVRISIHALRVEGDFPIPCCQLRQKQFLSTPSGWRATAHTVGAAFVLCVHFYPRPPGGGRLVNLLICCTFFHFYPRPPGGGRLIPRRDCAAHVPYFYPRPPGGGRQQKRTKFLSVFAQKGEEFASLRRGKRKFAGSVLKRTNFGL